MAPTTPMLAALTLLASSSCCEAFVLGRVPFTPVATTARAPAETLSMNLFDNLSKIVDYNKKYFETALSSMFDDRTARASHVLFGFNKYGESGQAEAEALKSKIEAGEVAFANAAQEYSTCPSSAKGGDLGTFGKGAMVPEFDAVCFDDSIVPGAGTVTLVKTQFGWHLVQVTERSEAKA